ncbi:alpha-1,6-mannosyltransferase Och1 [Metarhizium acridum]|nr:alpha-1,6-mannosyltransferase Och1 [Metarhizium acridum]
MEDNAGRRRISPFREQEASWTLQHPTFVHEVITDSVAESLLQLFYAAVPEVLETYSALPLPVLKADFFRYLILFARGGIYSDIDTYAIKSAIEWVPSHIPRETIGLVVGIEADLIAQTVAEWYSRRIQFCQWTIQSKPGIRCSRTSSPESPTPPWPEAGRPSFPLQGKHCG